MSAPPEDRQLMAQLAEFSACEISDALLKLESPSTHGGFLDGIHPLSLSSPPSKPGTIPARVIAPAFPVHVAPLSAPSALAAGTVWSDACPAEHLILLVQPSAQRCAALGGIHAARLKARGCVGAVVSGRVRDQAELRGLVSEGKGRVEADGKAAVDGEEAGIPAREGEPFAIWHKSTSIVGAGAEGHVVRLGGAVDVDGVLVHEGDWLVLDYGESAVVRVPRRYGGDVVKWATQRRVQDDQVMAWVQTGGSVAEGFGRFRGKIEI